MNHLIRNDFGFQMFGQRAAAATASVVAGARRGAGSGGGGRGECIGAPLAAGAVGAAGGRGGCGRRRVHGGRGERGEGRPLPHAPGARSTLGALRSRRRTIDNNFLRIILEQSSSRSFSYEA